MDKEQNIKKRQNENKRATKMIEKRGQEVEGRRIDKGEENECVQELGGMKRKRRIINRMPRKGRKGTRKILKNVDKE